MISANDEDVDSYVLRFRPGRESVIVASNGWEQPSPEWEVLANGTILEVNRSDLRTTVYKTT